MVFNIIVPFIYTFINAHLAMYLILRRNMSAKGTKKITSPNVIRLQYVYIVYLICRYAWSYLIVLRTFMYDKAANGKKKSLFFFVQLQESVKKREAFLTMLAKRYPHYAERIHRPASESGYPAQVIIEA